jgi:hypothetical protein
MPLRLLWPAAWMSRMIGSTLAANCTACAFRATRMRSTAPAGSGARPAAFRAPWWLVEWPSCVLKSLPTPGRDDVGFMRNKWVELMIRGGNVACAEIAYNRKKSPSNFNAMCRARVMHEAAVEAIGRDVVAKSMAVEDATLRRTGLRLKLSPRPRPDAA